MTRQRIAEIVGSFFLSCDQKTITAAHFFAEALLFEAAQKICFHCRSYGPSQASENNPRQRYHKVGKESWHLEICKAIPLYIED